MNFGSTENGGLAQARLSERAPQTSTEVCLKFTSRSRGFPQKKQTACANEWWHQTTRWENGKLLSIVRGVKMKSKARIASHEACGCAGIYRFICFVTHQRSVTYSSPKNTSEYTKAPIKPELDSASESGRDSQVGRSFNFHASYKANPRPLCKS